MGDLVAYLARALVDNPDAVSVEVIEGEGSDTVELTVDPSDLGKVIGRQGRTARALRAVLRGAAAKQGRGSFLEIVE